VPVGTLLALLGVVLALAPGGGPVAITCGIALAAIVVGRHLISLGLRLKQLR
jgi:uncharacterized membrane protein HdeD (DUF308 family)